MFLVREVVLSQTERELLPCVQYDFHVDDNRNEYKFNIIVFLYYL
jgi:hypothetical protein